MKKVIVGFVLALMLLPRVMGDGAEDLADPTHQLIINEVMVGSEMNPDKDHWIELYNPGAEEVLLGGWQIRGVTLGGAWINVVEEDYRAIQPGSYFLISHYTNSRSSALEVRPQVNKASIQFPAGLIQIELQDPQGQLVDRVVLERSPEETDYRSFERVLPDAAGWHRSTGQVNLKAGLALTHATPFTLNSDQVPEEPEGPSVPLATILVNEILPDPKKRETEDEFVELLNVGGAPADLRGWELDDENLEDDHSYFFIDEARDYILDPGEFMVLYRAETQVSFENLGDGVELFDPEGNSVDSYFYAPDLAGRSHGRNPENPEEWLAFFHPTPGTANIEVNQSPQAVIELQRDSGGMSVNVAGAASSDPETDTLQFLWEFEPGATDGRPNPLRYTYGTPGPKIIRLTVTDEFGASAQAEMVFEAVVVGHSKTFRQEYPVYEPIHEFMVNPPGNDEEGEWIELFNSTDKPLALGGWFLDDDERGSSPYAIPPDTFLEPGQYWVVREPNLGLSLKNSEDQVRLLDPNREPKQMVSYSAPPEGWSYARGPDGNFEWTPLATSGASNTFLPHFSSGDLLIEAVLPNPAGEDQDHEKIVLRNLTPQPVALANWILEDKKGQQFTFSSKSLNSGEARVFDQNFFNLNLNNQDEVLKLYAPRGNLIDQIEWQEAANNQWIFKTDHWFDGIALSVERVIDGDTLVVNQNPVSLPVRLIGVNTPETVHPFKPVEFYGKEASDYLKYRLEGQTVSLSFDSERQDKYGRLLAYVYLEDTLINAELIEKGYGFAYTRFPFKFLEEFVKLQAKAQLLGVGLWQNPKVSHQIEALVSQADPEIPLATESFPTETAIDPVPAEPVALPPFLDCLSENLKIDSILPNPKRGEAVEFIRLKNVGTSLVCLEGWSLEDDLGKGSKPYLILSGGIEPGGLRTFRMSETGVRLNNSNDCATLIRPDGLMADQLCYTKAHKNEVFTHAGGNFKPKPRVARRSRAGRRSADAPPSKIASSHFRIIRPPMFYQTAMASAPFHVAPPQPIQPPSDSRQFFAFAALLAMMTLGILIGIRSLA